MKIFCNGCSYTAKTSEHRTERYTWSMFLQKELSRRPKLCVHVPGNYIKETTIEYLESNPS